MKGKSKAGWVLTLLMLLAVSTATALTEKPDFLSDEEEDKVRDAQDPTARIVLYLDFAQNRLEKIENFRSKPMDPEYDNGAYIDHLLDEYISITDALKNWIQEQYDRRADMRKGLTKVLEGGPRQLAELRRIKESPDRYAADYAKSLGDARDDLTDALDGATKALGGQVKMFGDLKTEANAESQAEKARMKEEKKRTKEEEKLLKKQRKQAPPSQNDED